MRQKAGLCLLGDNAEMQSKTSFRASSDYISSLFHIVWGLFQATNWILIFESMAVGFLIIFRIKREDENTFIFSL